MGLGRRQCQQCLDWVFGEGTPSTPDGVLYIGLSTADPGPDGQSNAEPAIGTYAYARVATADTDWDAATLADPSVVDNGNVVQFPQASGGDWSSGATFTHATFWTASTGETESVYVGCAPLTTGRAVLDGDQLSFPAGDLAMNMADGD